MKRNYQTAPSPVSISTATDAVVMYKGRPELPDPTPEEIAAQAEADKPRED